MKPQPCFECRKPAEYNHHVVPKSKGGTITVPLCAVCHGKAHDITMKNLTHLSMKRLKAAGRHMGGKPQYGFRKTRKGDLIRNEAEQVVIALVMECYKDGEGLHATARHLNSLWFRSRARRKFQATQVKQMITQWKYMHGNVYPNSCKTLATGSHNDNNDERYQHTTPQIKGFQLCLDLSERPHPTGNDQTRQPVKLPAPWDFIQVPRCSIHA